MTTLEERARTLQSLHAADELLVLLNVWDVASAKVVEALPGCRAIATASHSIAATFGYADGEQIPLATMLDMVTRIVAAVEVPVSADLEAGYGNPGETVRRAIGCGVVGANLEDAMKPFTESVAAVEAAMLAAEGEGVPFVLNARTDSFLYPGARSPEQQLADAIQRGRAYLEAGASCVFVPGSLDVETVGALVEGLGDRRVSVIGGPGRPAPAVLQQLGVARLSYGPWTQRIALTAVLETGTDLLAGGDFPADVQPLS